RPARPASGRMAPVEDAVSREVRICVVGDELSAGVGDAKALGWAGRVVARTRFPQPAYVFPLAIPGETTTALSQRWEAETARRFSPEPDVDNRLVIGLGRHDLDAGLSVARSRLNLANVLDDAESRRLPPFVVGPSPGHAQAVELLAVRSLPVPY